MFLPFRNEWDHLVKITEKAVRDHWPVILRVAAALEDRGLLEDEALDEILLQPVSDWPPPPPRR